MGVAGFEPAKGVRDPSRFQVYSVYRVSPYSHHFLGGEPSVPRFYLNIMDKKGVGPKETRLKIKGLEWDKAIKKALDKKRPEKDWPKMDKKSK